MIAERARALAVSFLAVLALFALLLRVFAPAFQTNDDAVLMAIASGIAYGAPSPHLIFVHPGLGWVVASLYAAWPGIPWYAFSLYLAQVVAWTLILHGLLALRASGFALALFGVAFVFFGLEIALELQFTSTAILVGAAAPFHLLATAEAPPSRGRVLGAGLLLGASGLLRISSLEAAVVAWTPMLVIVGLRRFPRRSLWFASGTLSVLGAAALMSFAFREADPRWRDFDAFNRARANLEVASRSLGPQALARVGWSLNDYLLFRDSLFLDRTTYSADRMQALFESVDPRERSFEIRRILERYARRLELVLAVALLGLLFAERRRALLVAANGAWMFGLLAVVSYAWGRFPSRVAVPLLLILLLACVLATGVPAPRWRARGWRDRSRLAAVALAVCIALPGAATELSKHARRSDLFRARSRALVRELELLRRFDPEGVFVHWPALQGLERLSPFAVPDELPRLKLVLLGWMVNSPPWLDHLRSLGVEDPIAAILEGEHVHLVCGGRCRPDRARLLETFAREHRGERVEIGSLCLDPSCEVLVWKPAPS